MDELILDILKQLRNDSQGILIRISRMLINFRTTAELTLAPTVQSARNSFLASNSPLFLQVKAENDELWQSWNDTLSWKKGLSALAL